MLNYPRSLGLIVVSQKCGGIGFAIKGLRQPLAALSSMLKELFFDNGRSSQKICLLAGAGLKWEKGGKLEWELLLTD